MKNKKYTVCSLFAGVGGIELAFEKNGFKTVWANEIDKYACRTYRLNFKKTCLVEDDIRNIPAKDIPLCDVLTAGFPCQTFSSVGLQQGFNDERGNMFFEIARILKENKFPILFFENVANLVKHDNGNTFKIILDVLENEGYFVKYKVMNAADYGVPQQRNRIYIVAFKNKQYADKFNFPKEQKLKHKAQYYLSKEKQDASYYLDNHKKWEELDKTVIDKERIYRFTDWGISSGRKGICPTLLAAMGSPFERIPFFKDAYSIRKLTQFECAQLQGFPKKFNFDFKAPKQVYKQIGNSVCVPVVELIVKEILKVLESE